MIHFFSNELHVNKQTPGTILIHTNDDKVVSVKNSIFFLQKNYTKMKFPLKYIFIREGGTMVFFKFPNLRSGSAVVFTG